MRSKSIAHCESRREITSFSSTRIARCMCAFVLLLSILSASVAFGQGHASLAASNKIRTVGRPLFFERKAAGEQEFLARGKGHTLVLTKNEAVLALESSQEAAVRMSFSGADQKATVNGEEELPGKVYHVDGAATGALRGNETFGRVRYSGIYPGIDAVYYGNEQQLEFDLVVAPHTDPNRIRLAIAGADKLHLTSSGEVALQLGDEQVTLRRPAIYQEHDGSRTWIAGRYAWRGKKVVGFEIGAYDPNVPLIIDPSIAFATYLGGPGNESVTAVKVSRLGEIYVAASSDSVSSIAATQQFPVEAPQSGFVECFLTKLSADGSQALYTVIFNGVRCEAMDIQPGLVHLSMGTGVNHLRTLREDASGQPSSLDLLQGAYDFDLGPVEELRVDGAGNIYMVAFDQPDGSPNPIYELQKIDAHGQLLGKIPLITAAINNNFISEQITGLDIDDAGNAYVVGIDKSTGVITPTANAFQPVKPSNGADDAFLLRINTSQPGAFQIDYATFLGGSSDDEARQVAFDSSTGTVLVAGDTASSNFPTSPFSPSYNLTAGFLTKLDLSQPPSTQMVGSVLIGPSFSGANLVTVLPGGIPAVAGTTFDTSGFLLVNPIYLAQLSSENRPFLRTYTPDLSQITFSTFLDNVPGSTFAAVLAANGTQSLYVAVDTSDGTLGTPGAFHSSGLGGDDVLLSSLDVSAVVPADQPPVITFTPVNLSLSIIVPNQPVAFPLACGQLFQCRIQDPDGDLLTDFAWYGSNGYHLEQTNSSTGVPPSDILSLAAGTYTFTLKVRDARGAIGSATLTVNVLAQNTFTSPDNPETIQLTDELFDSPDYVYKGNVHPATITFPAVLTAGLTWLQSRADLNPVPPAGMQAGSPPYYYDIHTTASFSGRATLCLDSTGMSFADPANVQLFELQSGVWTPLSAGQQGNSLCATTNLPNTNGGDRSTTVAFFYPQVPATAITAIAGTGYQEGSIDGPGGDPRDDVTYAGPALQSALTRPASLAYNPNTQSLYISGSGQSDGISAYNLNSKNVYLIVPAGQAIGSGPIVIDPSGTWLYYVAPVDSSGAEEIVRLNLSNLVPNVIAGGASSGGTEPLQGQLATSSFLANVNALAADSSGNVFLTRDGTSSVLRVNASDGTWSVVLDENPNSTSGAPTTPFQDFPRALAFDQQSYLLVGGQTLVRVSPGQDGTVDGSSSSTATLIGGIPAANMTGYAQPFAGDGLSATQAALFISYAMFVAPDGAVIFDDGVTHRVRRIDPGADGVVNGDPDEIVHTIVSYYSFTQAPQTEFATSSYGDFRGLVQDPFNSTIYAASYSGNQVFAIGTSVTAPVNTAPQALSVSISGDPHLGQLLTGQYVYFDADGDAQGTSTFRWLRDGAAITGATGTTYTVVAADSGHVIAFEVTPVAAAGVSPGAAVQSSPVAILNSAPVASSVSIFGTPKVGSALTGSYSYSDAESDPEGASLFQWLRDGSPIGGATGITYLLTTVDAGHAIVFQVTPVAVSGVTPGTAVRSTSVKIGQAPAFTSGTSTTFVVGSLGAFTFAASGTPAPTFSVSPALPGGLSLNSATGVLSGKPGGGTGGVYALTATATNGVSPDATQSFTLVIDESPTITSTAAATFTVGTPGSFQLTASGYPAPAISETTTLPTGITYNPATQTLSGTPAPGTGQVTPYTVNFTAANSAGTSSQAFALTIQQAPAITSSNASTFQLGAHGTSMIAATGFPIPTVSVAGTPPAGITITSSPGQALIGGTPSPGTEGSYGFTVTVNNGVGAPATQSYTLTVSASAAPVFTIASLGFQCVGGTGFFCSDGLGINNNGQVVGEVWTGTASVGFFVPFLSSPPYGGLVNAQLLETTELGDAVSVNNEGQVTGSFAVGGDTSFHAFLESPPYNTFTDLGDPGGGLIEGSGINDSRQIAGAANFAINTPVHAILWDGTMHDLGTLNGDNSSQGYGINASGQIAGTSESVGNVGHAFLYTPANGAVPSSMISLGNPVGGSSEGLALNNSGQVTGSSNLANTYEHAFLWDGTMHDIGSLEGGFARGYGINNLGQITGVAETADGQSRAFLYTAANEMLDLNSLIPSNSGWTLLYGFAINDAGQITGRGIDPSGKQNAFVLTPTGPPVAGGATVSGSSTTKPTSGTANVIFTITVNNITNGPLAVNFNTADGTAMAGADYIASTGTLTFAPGTTSQTVAVQINGGAPNPSDRFFSLQVRSAGTGSLLATGVGTIHTAPTHIVYSLTASPSTLSLAPSSDVSSVITLQSQNGVSETAHLTAAWKAPAPSGVTFTLVPSDVTIPPQSSGSAIATLTVATSSSAPTGTFVLTVTATSASGVTKPVDVTVTVTGSAPPPPSCCTSAGPFVAPAPGVNLDANKDGTSAKGKYQVTASGGAPAGLANIQVVRVSDHRIMLTTQSSNWGFSPDEDRFVTSSVQDPGGTSIHQVSLYDFTRTTPQAPTWTSGDSTHSARIQFSPSGHYLFYTDVVGGPRTQLILVDAHTGTVEFTDSIQPFAGAPVQGESGDSFGTVGWGFGPKDTRFVYAYLAGQSNVLWNLINLEKGPAHAEVKSLSLLNDTSEFWQFSSCGEVIGLVRQPGQQSVDVAIYNTKDGTPLGTDVQIAAPIQSFQLHSTSTSYVATNNGTDHTLGQNNPDCATSSTPPPPPSCCTSSGPFVDPAPGVNLDANKDGTSSKGKYQVNATGGAPAGLANIQVVRVSDHKIMLTTQSSNWGFSPDEDRFVTSSVQDPAGTSIHQVSLYDLTRSNPQAPIWTSSDSTHSARIQFSPSGSYLFYTDVVGGPLTQLALVDAHTGTVEFSDSFPTSGGAPIEGQDSFGTAGWGFGPSDTRFVYAYLSGPSNVTWKLINLENGPAHAMVKNLSLLNETADYWQFASCGEVIGLVHQKGQQGVDIEVFHTKDGTSLGTDKQIAAPVQQLQLHTTPTSYVATNNAGSATDYTLGQNQPDCSLSVSAHSPVDILLIDAQGRRCGFDSSSGTVLNEIPGGSYTGPGTEPETITVPYAIGTYQIEAYGLPSLTAAAPYRLSIATANDTDTTDEHDIAGVASSETLQQFVFTVDGNLTVTDLSPVDKTPPIVTPITTGTARNTGWYVSNVAVSWNVVDGESPIQSSSGCGSTSVSSDTTGMTFTCTATSAGGTASNSITVKRDTMPPKIACGSPDGKWHASDVSIPCTASDGGSGLAAAASFALTTAVPAGTESANASTGSLKVCDVAGNCANAGPIGGNMIDKKAPAITLTTPANGAVYSANQAVNASYSCSDGGSGVASCVGTGANGAKIDTAPNGISTSKTFTVNSADKAGNAVSQVDNYVISCHYVAIGIKPSTVTRKNVVAVTADVMSCTSSSQSISVKFELTGPRNSNSCGSTKTLMFTTPPFTIPPKTSKAISFPFIVPKTMCTGTYSVTSTTLIQGTAVDSTTATLTVQ